MRIRTHYSSIERIVYEFNESDIRRALEKDAKITYKPGRRLEFELDSGNEDNGYKITATITEIFETPQEGSEADE